MRSEARVERIGARAFTVPTDEPESDGTFEWSSTTIVVVEAAGGGETGLGYTYGHAAVAELIRDLLAESVVGKDALAVAACWDAMQRRLRTAGRPGLGAMALAAVDIALWDLKARLLGVALRHALDSARDSAPIYGSGGFTSYSNARLAEQLAEWVAAGIPRVKMKVGRDPDADRARVDAAREAIGDEAELLVDANGAYSRKQALAWAARFRERWNVTWLEEPVSSDDLEGLRLLRDRCPAGLDIAAGEYGDTLASFERLLEAGAVDCMQVDVTRCGGITGLLRVAPLAEARSLEVSAHCAPAVSAHAFCAVSNLRHVEYFHDHVRVESLLFDGVPEPAAGVLRPDDTTPGLGLELRRADAERLAA
jgi:L-alanine-DL-glutamate epimerase-like enolase superfamily enzyme